MKKIILITLLLLTQSAHGQNEFFGTWQFFGMRYQGKFSPAPNPDLVLRFQFLPDGTDVLSWSRKNEIGSCERKAHYRVIKNILQEEVFWVNPGNLPECNDDPDMRLGKKSETPARVVGQTLEIELHLDNEPLTYLWIKTDNRAE